MNCSSARHMLVHYILPAIAFYIYQLIRKAQP